MDKILDVTEFGDISRVADEKVWGAFIKSMCRNNTFCPAVKRVIFNLGTKNDRKVLGTTVFFSDGTKTSVINSENDGLTFVDATKEVVKVDETGKSYTVKEPLGFTVASDASKEMGLVYAIVKRMFGTQEINKKTGKPTDVIIGNGFGRKLRDLVEAGYDTQLEDYKNKEAKKAAKAEYEARKNTAKKRRPSLAETVDKLADIVEKLAAKA